ncbi:putative cystathionine gamma-lyase 2 [Littorina saxatilis]|uniref:cystathionine gamma-lyase n=1 Tax=Littorina saxatilis TaxID=31220 RepID=A0AAN9B740_9CAEN
MATSADKKQEVGEGETLGLATLACHAGSDPRRWTSRDVIPPISMATTFLLDDPSDRSGFLYTRVGNPTRRSLEECLAAVEGARYAFCFSSGLAALLNTTYLLRAHDHIVCSADVYGGTYRFLKNCAARMALDTTNVDCTDVGKFQKAFLPNTKMVWLETVSNPTMKVLDLKALVSVSRQRAPHAIIIVDNTFLTPYLHKPLECGVDVVMHSLTKYINGHSDVLMGSLALNDPKLADELRKLQNYMGAVPSPFDCFLTNRGLRTLEVRMLRHGDSALQVARALESNPRVERVLHPGLPSHPQHKLAIELLTKGFCGVFSCYVNGTAQQTKDFMNNVKIFALAFSLGGHESLIELPREMTHSAMTEEERQAIGITDTLVRISIGLEDPRDLIRDLEQALLLAIPNPKD